VLTRDVDAFVAHARTLAPDFGPATAQAAFLVAPDGFALASESALDNRYMADATRFDAAHALRQHRELHRALSESLPVVCFPGDPQAPDALFPNNVFASALPDARTHSGGKPRLIVGRMRHPVRQREAARDDIRSFFRDVLGYAEIDLSRQPHPCELTGALVIDRARGLGFCGLSERCDAQGAALLHDAFGLRATLAFDLAPGEYHTNVVLAVLAGRAALFAAESFADPAVPAAIATLYAPYAIAATAAERDAFVCNAIALGDAVWMSAAAAGALRPETRAGLERAGFRIREVELDAIEAAGGSLRCCVAEIFRGP
jgi:N-dimethylarginine dimethylaminohydrolase